MILIGEGIVKFGLIAISRVTVLLTVLPGCAVCDSVRFWTANYPRINNQNTVLSSPKLTFLSILVLLCRRESASMLQ